MEKQISPAEYAREVIARFDVAKYSQAADLSILDWRALISYRAHVAMNMDWMLKVQKHDRLNAYIRRIDVAPMAQLGTGRAAYGPSVTSLTVADAFTLRSEIEAHMPHHLAVIEALNDDETDQEDFDLSNDAQAEALMKAMDERRELEEKVSVGYSEELSLSGIDSGGFEYVALEIDAPDDVLVDHFKEWLRNYRAKNGKASAITDADMRKWAQHRVLPYLDLKILSKLAEVEPTNYSIGCILFADQKVDVAEKVRKTTAPIADWMLNEGSWQIAAKANAELRKLNGKNWGHETFRNK